MFNKILCFLALCLWLPGLAGAQPIPLPVVDGWHVEKHPISLTINDMTKAYVGFELKYQNPDDMNEFVTVIMRTTPVIIQRLNVKEKANIQSIFVQFFGDKEEEDLLSDLYTEKSDPIIVIRYKIFEDPVTHQPIQYGNTAIWFQDYSGEWTVYENEKIRIGRMTGASDFVKGDAYSVGRKYAIADKIHILKVDSTYLIIVTGKEKK